LPQLVEVLLKETILTIVGGGAIVTPREQCVGQH
jgi:hypothetical protein